ncbi:MAG: hypothetical protein EOR46_02115 [Mesorhizobium sp.]|nr:MAG: hypothetical protein EOR46_02115 [Mesorhizobium sp.]RWK70632.1 MAG: hypothetical protein EOR54_03630 [Mesorhizobium sp.]RWK81208.1 MAG: hypothetical protein EOR50_02115 [Mesorhizobium sp.]RWK84891.1 MAG: hypothetical protein EOR51_00305 [Mesorhizobium sp.]RWL07397.1 MAG: hypothetical protein EOR55_07030 [Mesorhizobium sp.]
MLHSFAPPSVLPDISPTRGEIGSFVVGSSSCNVADWRQQRRRPISPQVGEISGRTEGGAKDHGLPDCRPSATRQGCSR